jgi:hypothetical protein
LYKKNRVREREKKQKPKDRNLNTKKIIGFSIELTKLFKKQERERNRERFVTKAKNKLKQSRDENFSISKRERKWCKIKLLYFSGVQCKCFLTLREYVFMHKIFFSRNIQNQINIIRKIKATKETLIPDYAVTIICQFIFYLY